MVGQIQVDPSEVQAMGSQVTGNSAPLTTAGGALQGISASGAGVVYEDQDTRLARRLES
jgi:hypothetical protein